MYHAHIVLIRIGDPMNQILYVNTTQQLAHRWTQLTLLVNIMTTTKYTQSNLSV